MNALLPALNSHHENEQVIYVNACSVFKGEHRISFVKEGAAYSHYHDFPVSFMFLLQISLTKKERKGEKSSPPQGGGIFLDMFTRHEEYILFQRGQW